MIDTQDHNTTSASHSLSNMKKPDDGRKPCVKTGQPSMTHHYGIIENGQKAIAHGLEKQRAISVDYERYAALLDDPDLSEKQKQEFLQTLWNIIVGFVELGFGVHPIQLVEQETYSMEENAKDSKNVSHALESTPTDTAQPQTAREQQDET